MSQTMHEQWIFPHFHIPEKQLHERLHSFLHSWLNRRGRTLAEPVSPAPEMRVIMNEQHGIQLVFKTAV